MEIFLASMHAKRHCPASNPLQDMKPITMRIKNGYWKWLAAVVATAAISANAGEATFTFDDDPRDLFEGLSSSQEDVVWSEDGDWAGTGNPGGFLSITEATGGTRTVAIFPDIDNGKLVKAFNLKADIRTGNGTSDRPADGFSISYARSDDPVFDGGFSLPGPPENGTRTGIVVSFDTWQGNRLTDGSGDIEGIIVVVDGKAVEKTPLPTRHGDCDDITSLQTGPQGSDDGDYPRGDPGTLCWAPFEVNLTEDGLLTVKWKGNTVLDNFQSNFFPSPGQLVIAGRTGGANEILHVDNIELNTQLADAALLSGLSTTVNGFSVSFRDVGSSKIDPATVSLTLDGAAVTGEVSKDGDITTAVYSQKAFFGPSSEHVVGIVANGGAIDKKIPFTTPGYGVVGAENALTGNFNKRGFLMRVLQAGQGLANNTALREQHLAGSLTDADGEPLENLADDFGSNDFVWDIEGVINFDQDGNPQGVFRDSGDGSATDVPDDFIPGIPGIDGSTDNITGEILTVVEIPSAGLYRFGFNSDDGFKTTAGNTGDAESAIIIAEFNGGRGASTTLGTVLFEEAGFYKLRSIWYEGGGGANLEWWTADENGDPIALLNDSAAGGLKTYRQVPEDPAAIVSSSPAKGAGEQPTSGVTLSVNVKNGSTSVDSGSAKGTFNGSAIDVSSSTSDGIVTLSAETGELEGNTEYSWSITFTAGGVERSASGTFRSTVLAGDGLLFIENEDFNYELGKWDSSNETGMGGAYAGGTYQDLGDGIDESDVDSGTSYGVDYFESNNGNSQAVYRPDTGVEAGKTNNGDIGLFRGAFEVETNHVVGWNDGGDWMNYTREFPAEQNYNIFGRLSSGGAAINTSLHLVTGDASKPNQDTEVIGHWKPGRNTGGWNSYEIFPLLDDAGDAAVASLGGKVTLRYHTNGGNNDNDFIVFVPAAAAAPEPEPVAPPVVLPPIVLPPIPGAPVAGEISGISRAADGSITIEFTGKLQSSATVDGTYADVAGASSPYKVDASGSAMFYLAR